MAITFDGPTKLMTLTTGTVSVSVRELWSRWVDWFMTSDNSKYLPAFTSVGGDEITSEISVPIYAFLMNGWRVKPQEANHTLVVGDGILVVSGGGDPFVNTSGSYIVRINYQQPVQALTVATGGSTGPTVSEIVAGVWTTEDTIKEGMSAQEAMVEITSFVEDPPAPEVDVPAIVDGVLNTPNSIDTGITLGDAVRLTLDLLEAIDVPEVSEIVDGVLNTEDSISVGVTLGDAVRNIVGLLEALDIPIPPEVSAIVDGVLNTPDSIDPGVTLGSGVRALLTLLPLLDLDEEQAAKVAALFQRFALDVSVPVTHAESGIVAGDIEISITDNEDGTFTEQRQ